MPSILVATGFVRIDADNRPALKAFQALGAIGANALSTALVPAAAAATTAVLAVGSAAATAGGAVAAYGVAVGAQFKQITEASQKQTAAEDAKAKATANTAVAQRLAKENGFQYGTQVEITAGMTDAARQKAEEYNSALSAAKSATKSAAESQEAYKQKLASMPPATRDTAEAMQNLKASTTSWSDSLSSSTMPVFTRGIQFLEGLLPKLTPIVKDVAAEVDDFVGTLGEGTAGKVFREFGKNVTDNGAGALRTFLDVGKNLTVGILGILNAFTPMADGMTGGLENLTEKFANWGATLGESQGFQSFLKMAEGAGPRISEAFSAIARAMGDVVSAAGPMAGIGLTLLTLFANLVDAIPTPVLQLLVPAILAVNTALKLYAIYQAAANAVTWLFLTPIVASNGALATSRAALIAFRIQQIASATATGIATAATWAWNAAMLVATSPITLVIVAIGALVAAIVWIALKTDWFSKLWSIAWGGIKTAAEAVGKWFAGPFVAFFKAGWDFLRDKVLAPIASFFTQTIPAAAGVLRDKVVGWWTGMQTGIKAVWDFLYKWVFAGNIKMFRETIPSAAKSLKEKVATWWGGMQGAIKTVWDFLYKWVFAGNIKMFRETLPNAAKSLKERVTSWWGGMRDGVRDAYTWMRDKIFNPIGTFFTSKIPGWAKTMRDKVKGFFTEMKDGIGTIWDGIKSKVKSPINWVIKHVWNQGIVSIWKKITGWIGLGNKLKEIKLLAAGGTVGRTPVGIFNRPTAIVGEGNSAYPEYVIPTDPKYATRARGLWQAAGAHFMADGGVIDWVSDKASDIGGAIVGGVKSVADFMTDPVGKAKKMLLSALGNIGDLGSSPWVKMVAKIPRMAIDGLIDMVKDSAGDLLGAVGLGSGNGGSGVQRWKGVVQMLLKMLGQPAAYTDLTLRRMNQESGGNPTVVNKWDSNWQAGYPSVGLMQVIRGTFQAYAGKYRNTGPFMYGVSVNPAANIYASMKYALSRYGSLPRAYNRAGGYANGTAGTTSGVHLFGENGPELGYSPAGWRILNARRTAAMSGGATVIERLVLENHGIIASRQEAEDWLVQSLVQLERKGRIKLDRSR